MLLHLTVPVVVTRNCTFLAQMRQLMKTVTLKQEKTEEIHETGKREQLSERRRHREFR